HKGRKQQGLLSLCGERRLCGCWRRRERSALPAPGASEDGRAERCEIAREYRRGFAAARRRGKPVLRAPADKAREFRCAELVRCAEHGVSARNNISNATISS